MTVFVDTSALYATLDAADPVHPLAARAFFSLRGEELMTHNYVVVESAALVQRRLGSAALRDLADGLLGPVQIVFVDNELHASALTALLASRRRGVSLVDHTSFEVMRRRGITRAFAFDADFVAEGFETVP
ncbi:MAG: type II toxin-antitoxin system VapC family toxin [Acidimicrobiia bacterium]